MVVIWTLAAVVFILWIIWRWQQTSIFSKLGIPGPEPSLLFGNIIELYRKGPVKCHEEWVRRYGRILGYYHGMKPILLVADPQMLKNIFVKDFSKFINRVPFNPLHKFDPSREEESSVLNLEGQPWKEVRSVLTPTFTVAKLKQMAVSMNSSIDVMLGILRKSASAGQVVNIHDTYQRLTMDVISRTAFGVLIDIQTEKDSKVLRATQLLFSTPFKDPLIFLGLCFPLLRLLCVKMQFILLAMLNQGKRPMILLRKGLLEVLEQRRKQPQARKVDLLQLLIDAKISVLKEGQEVDLRKLEVGNTEIESEVSKEEAVSKVTRNMTDKEIVASSVTVFLAGYETTSTALSFTTYLLAKYPEIQERTFQEIDELVRDGQKLEYSTVNKLPYLDQVLNESMRIYPPVYLFTNRFAVEDVEYGDLRIPKDMMIQAPVYLMHHDPELWADPETFDPDRFLTKPNADGVTFLPFGVGPRNCLGMRFAQMEAKLALAHVIYNFRILPTQKGHLETTLRMRTIAPTHGIPIRLETREK